MFLPVAGVSRSMRFASQSAQQESKKPSTPLETFLEALEDYEPERPGYFRSLRKIHVDAPAHFLRYKTPVGKSFTTKARAFVAEECTRLSKEIEACDGTNQGVKKLVEDIKELGDGYGTSQYYWKLWVEFAERFPTARLNLSQLSISNPENKSLADEFRHQERSAFVTEVISNFKQVRGSIAPPSLPDVKNVEKRIFYTIPVNDPFVGFRMEDDSSIMLLKYENGAKRHDPVAQTELANYYLTSFPAMSQWWYRKADELRYPPAQFHRAVCYEFGFAVDEQDLGEALRLYKEAASGGHTAAINNLGAILRTSFPELAFDFFLEASNRGDVDAICNLGLCFLRGAGIPQDLTNGIRLISTAAEYRHVAALYHLGSCSMLGIGTPVQNSLAVRYWGLAAQSGCHESAYNLGMCFLEGYHLPKNERAALGWFNQAAARHHPFGLFYQAHCYRHGLGTEKNEVFAFKTFHHAADQLKYLSGEMRDQLVRLLADEDIPLPSHP